MLSGRAAGVYARRMAGVRGPVGILLQGALIAFVGLLVTIFNLNNSVPIEKTSGAIQSDYVHSHADTPGNYVYNASWLQISTSIDLFIFNKNDFHPTWNDHVIRGQKVDIYYAGQSPKTILAIQLYDDGGNPSTRYTTTAYDKNPNAYFTPGAGLDVGLGIFAVGLLIAIVGALVVATRHRRRVALARETTSSSMAPARSLYASPPPKYEPPSRSSRYELCCRVRSLKQTNWSRSRIQLLILIVVAPIFVPLSIPQNLC